MRRILFLIVLLGLAGCCAVPPQQATRIETDQKTGVIRFIVDGKEQARIDKDGLRMKSGFTTEGEPGAPPVSTR
jgi:hypothetical protein